MKNEDQNSTTEAPLWFILKLASQGFKVSPEHAPDLATTDFETISGWHAAGEELIFHGIGLRHIREVASQNGQ